MPVEQKLIQDFYNQLQFPGHYTQQSLDYHREKIKNPYLSLIDRYMVDGTSVADIGCGTGLITNLFAQKYSSSTFFSMDFANSVEYGKKFAQQHNINNVNFVQDSIVDHKPEKQFDLVICQGVLHHIPDASRALNNLKAMVRSGGHLILGLYHPWGKIAKRWVKVDYGNKILHQDQENNPYETAYTCHQVKTMCAEFDLIDAFPSKLNMLIAVSAFFNFRNGGLVSYVLEKKL